MKKRTLVFVGVVLAAVFLALIIFASTGDESVKHNEDSIEEQPQYDENIDKEEESEQVEQTENAIETYRVFNDYQLDHIGYLSEGRTFYHSDEDVYVLGYGHEAHAVTRYELYEINEGEVSIIRSLTEDSEHFEHIESIISEENWEEEMVKYLLDSVEPQDELFFSYDPTIDEVDVVLEQGSYALYPVTVGEKTLYFKQSEGLWAKEYRDDLTIDMYGEKQFAVRKNEMN
ncbi:hypothetical protein [Halalkalibacter alkaliphilus]|uniref:Uncharacterized protein n=1 Tax=Halalkalibacter alkaliphilus TaxID=2917993 RepID=A0A9X2CUB3_9BACI|nr:hypothetical protein [Halalkalibacter alkaliphilus]MCL7748280.1 hypothetical protein [Halalkalibacter alkaliphilus]